MLSVLKQLIKWLLMRIREYKEKGERASEWVKKKDWTNSMVPVNMAEIPNACIHDVCVCSQPFLCRSDPFEYCSPWTAWHVEHPCLSIRVCVVCLYLHRALLPPTHPHTYIHTHNLSLSIYIYILMEWDIVRAILLYAFPPSFLCLYFFFADLVELYIRAGG